MKKIKETLITVKSGAILLCAATLFAFSSCGGSENLEKGTPIEFSKDAVKTLQDNTEENEGKRFSIEGYLTYSPGFAIYTNRPQTVIVHSDLEGTNSENNIAVSMPWKKDGKNSVFVAEDSENEDPIFYDNEGNSFTEKDKVIVSFSVTTADAFPTKVRIDKVK